MKNNQQWKKLLALTLCIVQCMVLLVPAVSAEETAPAALDATSVAVPESTLSDVPVTVTMHEEDSYWWGNASQATVKLGDPITNISDRYSWIFDSDVMEGYGNKNTGTENEGQTSNYFEFDTGWADFDMGKQDLMLYIELPETGSSFRFKHIGMDDWSKYPAPEGMTYAYLEADGTEWVKGTIDGNKQVTLTAGFKGFVRLQLNTASNAADYAESVLALQFFAIRFDAYGGDLGAAKVGGVWFVDKGEAYQVSVDGGETVALTTADPLPVPGEGGSVWDGDVLTATVARSEANADGEASSWVSRSGDNPTWSGIATQSVVTVTDSLQVMGMPAAAVIDSPINEGYFEDSGKTYPDFMMNIQWAKITPSAQDVMFYIELPEVAYSLRLTAFCISGWDVWLSRSGMQYQYLSMDSREWVDGTIDGNDQINLTYGFKGFVRLKPDTASNIGTNIDVQMGANYLGFRLDRFGGENGPVKIGGAWIVSKEDTRYISIDGGDTICMTDAVEPTWIEATSQFVETAAVGETAVKTVMYDKAWGGTPQAVATVGDCINPLNDGQKSIIIDSVQHEGYTLDDPTERTYPGHRFFANNPTVDMDKQDIMFYIELPEKAGSVRIDGLVFNCNGVSLTPGVGNMQYFYLPIDGSEWIEGTSDTNYTFKLTAGFKGYVRLNFTDVTGWWWQNHETGDAAWKELTATFNYMEMRLERFGADLGAAKFGGLWVIDKADFIDISVDGGEAQPMTSYVFVNPVLNAVSACVEVPETLWIPKVSAANAQISVENSITKISDRKAVVINSEEAVTYETFDVAVNAALAEGQDIMAYVELPAASQNLYVTGVTSYKYLSINAGNWIEATAENGTIALPAGFKGYVRMAYAAGEIANLTIRTDVFGGDNGALKLGGVWFVSGSDALYASVDGGDAIALGNLTDNLGLVDRWNVVLQDDIGVNFYVRVNENIQDTASIKITVDGKSVSYAVAGLTAEADGTYKVKVDVSAAQMTSPVLVQVVNDGEITAEKTYTVAQYANTILSQADTNGYYRLVKEMLNYGGAAQNYFGVNNHDMANAGLTGVAYNEVPETAPNKISISGTTAGVELYGATLVLRNQVAVRVYFQISDDATAHSFVCGDKTLTPVKAGDKYYVEIDGINPQNLDESVTVTVDNGLSVTYSPMNYMVRMNVSGSDNLKSLIRALYNYHVAADKFVLNVDDPTRYDLKVTTFNVGQWYHGVSNLDVYGAQVNAHPGITPDHIMAAYDQWFAAFPMHDADVIGAQEFRDIFYFNNQDTEDTADDVTMTAVEVLDDYFAQVESFTSATKNDTIPMWMGMMTPNGGRYEMHNVTGGELCADTTYPRAYMKGYVTVNGHEIAIYSVHLQPKSVGGWEYRQLAYAELIELTKQDEYVIVMGDMNSESGAEEYAAMVEAGFSMANCGKFGEFDTYEYREVDAIDNIFVTSNIEIVYAEAEPDKVGGSDHYPMSAYLMIKD